MKLNNIILFALITLTLQLCAADIETHSINVGQFTPIKFKNRLDI